MSKRIEELTPEQELVLPAKRDEWINHGLSTQEVDRDMVRRYLTLAYEAAGLPVPERIVWCHSPLEGVLTTAALRGANVGDNVWANVGANVRSNVGANVRANVGANVRANVRSNVEDNVWANVKANVGDNVWANVRANVRDNVRANVRDNVGDNVRANVGANVWANVRANVDWRYFAGHFEAGWMSFYDTFDALRLTDVVAPLQGLIGLAKNAGWCWFYRDLVIVCDRPERLCRDANGLMHSDDSMAIRYRDGYGFYMWHGTQVPEHVITTNPESWSVGEILKEDNMEVRRARIERLGWDRFVDKAELRLVDSQPDPANAPNTVDLYDLPSGVTLYDEPVRICLVTNGSPERDGTRRRFGITVDADHDDAISAIASTYRTDKATYQQLQRRT